MNCQSDGIWHPYWIWEEVKFNMWGSVENKKEYLEKAIHFTGDYELYGAYMIIVASQWKYSCEHHLTKIKTNRKAWIGHAASALAIQCPEDIVRQAWSFLDENQQNLANEKAQKAIEYWEAKNAEKITWY